MIKAIIFDFGGVITKGSFFKSLAEKLEKEIEIPKEKIVMALKESEDGYARGKETKETFWRLVSGKLGKNLDPEIMNKTFIASYEINKEMLQWIKKLRKKYKLILLSGNFKELADDLKEKFGDFFDALYFSNETGWVKPEKEAYEQVLREQRLNGEECIFIDDKAENLEPARRLGIKAIQYKNDKQVQEEFEKIVGLLS